MTEDGRMPEAVFRAIQDGMNPVRAWRYHRGMSQAALAMATGMGKHDIANLEAEVITPGPAIRESLARALETDARDFAGVDEDEDFAGPIGLVPANDPDPEGDW